MRWPLTRGGAGSGKRYGHRIKKQERFERCEKSCDTIIDRGYLTLLHGSLYGSGSAGRESASYSAWAMLWRSLRSQRACDCMSD